MSSYISKDLRSLVATRSNFFCEYCLIHEEDTFLGCEVDHIISQKHGGPTEPENLAYACFFCNRQKGSDIGSIFLQSGEFTRFFHPRKDRWMEHFRLEGSVLQAITEIGEVTARILGFNTTERLLEREVLIFMRRYPTEAALARMKL